MSKLAQPKRMLLHEYLWFILLGIIATRLVYSSHTGTSLSFILALMLLVLLNTRITAFVVRFGFYIVLMNVLFVSLRDISPLINPQGKVDSLLYGLDTWLCGEYLGKSLFSYSHSSLSLLLDDFFSFFYLLFLFELLYFFIYYLLYKPSARFFIGIMSVYAIGFLGYIFLPAIGPYAFLQDELTAPQGYFFYPLLAKYYTLGSNLTDVFPSLHCGISLFILLYNFAFSRTQFRIWLLPSVFLWISTIYLHYHYAIDCLAGFALAIICIVPFYLSTHLNTRGRK